VLLKLAAGAGIQGPVAGIVYAGRDFIDNEFALNIESFDREHAGMIKAGSDSMGDFDGADLRFR